MRLHAPRGDECKYYINIAHYDYGAFLLKKKTPLGPRKASLFEEEKCMSFIDSELLVHIKEGCPLQGVLQYT